MAAVIADRAATASAQPMPFPEVYTALETGVVDGQENPLSILNAAKFYEVTEQIVLTAHMVQPVFFAVAKPVWDGASRRLTGYEIIPLAKLGRPRVDVTLRISGFFRDAFPDQIALFDAAVRAVGALDEPDTENPLAARMRDDAAALMDGGSTPEEARRRAGFRVFGSRPGAYGAGLQALIESPARQRTRLKKDLAKLRGTLGID